MESLAILVPIFLQNMAQITYKVIDQNTQDGFCCPFLSMESKWKNKLVCPIFDG